MRQSFKQQRNSAATGLAGPPSRSQLMVRRSASRSSRPGRRIGNREPGPSGLSRPNVRPTKPGRFEEELTLDVGGLEHDPDGASVDTQADRRRVRPIGRTGAGRHSGGESAAPALTAQEETDHAAAYEAAGCGLTYCSDPGVVSSSPVSSKVFRPERTIGQPP
jgi:hypothetical protein